MFSKYRKYIFICSKAAIVLLFWNFAVNLTYGFFFIPSGYLQIFNHNISEILSIVIALTLLFSPVAGFLADVRLSCYDTVIFSSYLMLTATLCIFILICTIVTGKANTLYAMIFIGLFTALCLIGYSGYNANILQFGTDQLCDDQLTNSVMHHLKIQLYFSIGISGFLLSAFQWHKV